MGGKNSSMPVLVSVVLEMDKEEHQQMLAEWLPRHGRSGASATSAPESDWTLDERLVCPFNAVGLQNVSYM